MTDETSPKLRASHQDRDRVAEQLRIAAGDGRLTLEELDERLEKALSARTAGELVALVNDLPLTGPPAPKDLVRIDVQGAIAKRNGRWIVPRVLEITADGGSVELDLTTAVINSPTLRIMAAVTSGSLTLVTRPGIEVDADQVKVRSGSVQVRTPPPDGPSPETFLRVEVVGSVDSGSIVSRPPRRGLLAWLLRRPPNYGTP
ncbi:DUF1707 domain-containing protein [Spirillospora sp. NPDC048911]|uniref:DUF1707 SHOCT-like domain-containing protein n=1 Tax=Spirillospora sp. NPDC048911 TaxID=3364527 RepID=UPI003718CFF3